MRILHLTSDWKWTGPAEPMCIAADALRARGHRVDLACPPPPDGETGLVDCVRERGVEPVLLLERGRGIRPWRDRRDARRLRAWLAAERIDVLHVWHSRAHGLALRVRGDVAALVRAHADGRSPGIAERWMFERGCDTLVCTSEACARSHRVGSSRAPAVAVAGAVDLARFRPATGDERLRARERLGLAPEARVLGVVARVQRHRRFDLLLDGFAAACAADPRLRLVVLGRGTRLETVLRRPARERGIESRVVLPGHLAGEDYAACLRALDALCLLVPGSDGGARAVLEAAASGVPAVVTRRRGLPEWVADGETGLVVDESSDALVAAFAALLGDEAGRLRMAAAARARACADFAPARLGERLEGAYRVALS